MMLLLLVVAPVGFAVLYFLAGERWLPPCRGPSPFGSDIRCKHAVLEGRMLSVPSGLALAMRNVPRQGQPKAQAIVVHGLCLNGVWYASLALALEEAGIRTGLLDLPGHGRSEGQRGDVPPRQKMMSDLIHAMEEFAGHCPGLPLILIGHSAGAEFVLSSELVAGLRSSGANLAGLVGIAPYFAGAGLQARSELRHPLLSLNPRGFLSERWPALRYNLPRAWDDPDLQATFTRSLMALLGGKGASADRLERLGLPVLLLVGTEDRVISPKAVSRLASDRVRVRHVPDADHMSVISKAGCIIAQTYCPKIAA